MSYRQLTLDERYQISALRRHGNTASEIARAMGRHRSTITRELARNARCCETDSGGTVGYHAVYADQRTRRRRVAKGVASRKIQGSLQQIVELKLRAGWSPEQISGRVQLEAGVCISFETIYQHVIRDAQNGGTLRYCLRSAGYKGQRFRKSKHAERTRGRKHTIDQRPAAANERTELGHWERDCLLGTRGNSVLLTLVERMTRYSRFVHVDKLDAEHVAKATVEALGPFAAITRTITNDNGVEFQRAHELEQQLGVPIYFCEPSSPWQRGSVENTNGLARQFAPKSSDFDALPPWAAKAIEDTLNHRPRKTLGYRTPHEVLFNTQMELMNPSARFGLEFSASS